MEGLIVGAKSLIFVFDVSLALEFGHLGSAGHVGLKLLDVATCYFTTYRRTSNYACYEPEAHGYHIRWCYTFGTFYLVLSRLDAYIIALDPDRKRQNEHNGRGIFFKYSYSQSI